MLTNRTRLFECHLGLLSSTKISIWCCFALWLKAKRFSCSALLSTILMVGFYSTSIFAQPYSSEKEEESAERPRDNSRGDSGEASEAGDSPDHVDRKRDGEKASGEDVSSGDSEDGEVSSSQEGSAGQGARQGGESHGTADSVKKKVAASTAGGSEGDESKTVVLERSHKVQGDKQAEEKETKEKKKKNEEDTGFHFGSYGRVLAAGDGHGASAKPINVVSHGTRLEESTYLELDLYYKMRFANDIMVQTVTTLGFKDDLFHYSGDWTSALALRNLYVDATGIFHKGLTFWAGSRQYRGDDIYLLDYWPLDNLNTIGGGVMFRHMGMMFDLHGGVNRLRDGYQYQVVPVPGLNNTSEDVTLLDRQRFISSMKAGYKFGGKGGGLGLKIMGYGELHMIGAGTYNAHLEEARQIDLPSDQGWLVGAQLGAWGFGQRATHVNLFLRYAEGLAAYGELAVPWGVSNTRTTDGAKEFLLALSGNYEWRMLGVLVGGYARYFKNASVNTDDWDNGWEYILTARPQVALHKNFAQAVEVSYQGKWPFGLEPRTSTVQRPGITKLSIIPIIRFGESTYDRPQIRLVYTMALLNRGARLAYNPEDPRFDRKVQHYIGLQAEWWYNSTYR